MNSTDPGATNSPSPMPGDGPPPRRLWIISLVLHALALVAILFVPAKQYFEEQKEPGEKKIRPEIKRRGQELEKVMEQVRDITAERLAKKVALLDSAEDRMTTNFETLNNYHQPFEDQQRETALDRMAMFAERTLVSMNELRKKLEQAAKHQGVSRVVNELQGAEPMASRIMVGQEEIRRGLMFAAPDEPKLVEAQTKAEEAQVASAEHLGWSLSSARDWISMTEELKKVKAELPAAERAFRQAEDTEKKISEQRKKQQAQIKEIQDRKKRERKQLNKDQMARLDQQINDARAQEQRLGQQEREADQKLRDATRQLEQLRTRQNQLENNIRERDGSWKRNLEIARNTQNSAFFNERSVVNALLEKADKEPILSDEK